MTFLVVVYNFKSLIPLYAAFLEETVSYFIWSRNFMIYIEREVLSPSVQNPFLGCTIHSTLSQNFRSTQLGGLLKKLVCVRCS